MLVRFHRTYCRKTKIAIGNHEVDSSKLRKNYMIYFGLENQYYSFNEKNIHFLALSTEPTLMRTLNSMNLQKKIFKDILKTDL